MSRRVVVGGKIAAGIVGGFIGATNYGCLAAAEPSAPSRDAVMSERHVAPEPHISNNQIRDSLMTFLSSNEGKELVAAVVRNEVTEETREARNLLHRTTLMRDEVDRLHKSTEHAAELARRDTSRVIDEVNQRIRNAVNHDVAVEVRRVTETDRGVQAVFANHLKEVKDHVRTAANRELKKTVSENIVIETITNNAVEKARAEFQKTSDNNNNNLSKLVLLCSLCAAVAVACSAKGG